MGYGKMTIKQNPRVSVYILCFLSLLFMICSFIGISYASEKLEAPTYTIHVGKDGNITCSGNLFGDDLWYPGKEESGIIRIYAADGIKIKRLGVDIHIDDCLPAYSRNDVYDSFLNNMKLSVKRGRLLIFKSTLFENHSFSNLVANKGFTLDNSDQFSIGVDHSMDLLYTLFMDETAGEELQSVTASVSFKIDVEQN